MFSTFCNDDPASHGDDPAPATLGSWTSTIAAIATIGYNMDDANIWMMLTYGTFFAGQDLQGNPYITGNLTVTLYNNNAINNIIKSDWKFNSNFDLIKFREVKTMQNKAINKQTFYMIPRELLTIIHSYGFKNSKYSVNKRDLKNNWYIEIIFQGITFKIPFKALFHTNSKIKGIKGLDFNNASYCSSFLKGTCQIPCQKYCYAFVFERQYISSIDSKKGFMTFNSYYKGFLLTRAFKVIYDEIRTYNLFIEYINKNIEVLRFNVNSEFNNANDWNLILDIALLTSTIVYGYTARDDLLKGYHMLKSNSSNYGNLFVNGSNQCYDNRYYVTFDLKEYFMASFKCFGSCNDCKKCFKLQNKIIITLFHNSNADTILNTYDNRKFIVTLLNALDINLNLTENDLLKNKGIFSSLNNFFKSTYQIDLKDNDINNIKGLLDYIYFTPRQEFNCENMNKDILERYGLI